MRVPEHRGAGRGELIAIELPPGEAWLEIVGDLWWRAVPFLPVDVRSSPGERRRLLDLAQPTSVSDRLGETVYAGARAAPDLGAVVATSGTGGDPRLVELSRSAVISAIESSARRLGADDRVPWICCLTPAHVGGLLVLLRGAVLGAPVIVHERFDPDRVADSAADGAFVSLVPAMVSGLVRLDRPLHGLTMLVGGGPLDPTVAASARERGSTVVTTYGLTESCGGVVYDGRPLDGTRVRLGLDGTIELSGPTLMDGYRGDPAATGAAFTTDGWLRTGDLGGFGDAGRLEVHGRLDELIRTGGEKVWPGDVERRLASHPKVRDVAVVGVPHPEWGQQVAAHVVPSTIDDPPSLEELRAWVEDVMPAFKAPRELVLVAEVPRTPNGKLRRGALSEPRA